MRYTVAWKASAEQKLASLWSRATDRIAVASAANTIDEILRTNPASVGESRSGQTRVLVIPPLLVAFEVFEQDRMVHILSVRDVGRAARGG